MSITEYFYIAATVGLLALLAFYLACRLLISRSWILGWFRGNAGLIFAVSSVFLLLCAMDIMTFQAIPDDKTVLTLSVRLINGSYQISTVDNQGVESVQKLAGPEFSFRALVFKWSNRYESIGVHDGIRFHSLTSRLNPETAGSVERLYIPEQVDAWSMANKYFRDNAYVKPLDVSTPWCRASDGAMFAVAFQVSELVLIPQNEIAAQAVASSLPHDDMPDSDEMHPLSLESDSVEAVSETKSSEVKPSGIAAPNAKTQQEPEATHAELIEPSPSIAE